MTDCDECGVEVNADSVRVYLEHEPAVGVVLCPSCSTGKPGTRLFNPAEVPDQSRYRLGGDVS